MRNQTLMTKSELAMAISQRSGVGPYDASRVVNVLGEVVSEAVANDRIVSLPKLGKISKRTRCRQRGINFQTGKAMQVPAMQIPSIKWSKMLKGALRD